MTAEIREGRKVINRFIHLLYVPTMDCNMQCKYCYLEEQTYDLDRQREPLETLQFAVEKFLQSGVMPFNISLHGGEVTTLPKETFRSLIAYISSYYGEHAAFLKENGFTVGRPHIKTNLYCLDEHIDTLKEYDVSISGSLDLPFRLHDEFRVTKGGQPTLKKILQNVQMLDDLKIQHKKVSATIFKEHFDCLDEIVEDIKYLHHHTPLDMNDFNFMIGFDYQSNGILHPMTEEEQLILFNRMHEEFDNTDLDEGVNGAWFNEFGPEYCTNCDNCGDKFFLLEKNGDIYSCVRGQKHPDYYYGNIFENSVEEILKTANEKIFRNHHKEPMNEECLQCPYLYLCKTGCPFVKNVYHTNKSYTCRLQQALYKKRGYEEDACPEESRYAYLSSMHPELMQQYLPKRNPEVSVDEGLLDIIEKDPHLRYIYEPGVFYLVADGVEYNLQSQILKGSRDILYLTEESSVKLYVKKQLLEEECDYPQNNSLYMMLLSGDSITYGDEGRYKQRHIMTHQIYQGVLEKNPSDREGFYEVDLGGLLYEYRREYDREHPSNFFFTTDALRDYHYTKQKKNAYYHIQAINLPFQNIEFYYFTMDELKKELELQQKSNEEN